MLLDTIGFITGLPHDLGKCFIFSYQTHFDKQTLSCLVDSFKSTLMEVESADLVLHVRDISHPHTEDQKLTVLKVLKELGFDQAFYTGRMV